MCQKSNEPKIVLWIGQAHPSILEKVLDSWYKFSSRKDLVLYVKCTDCNGELFKTGNIYFDGQVSTDDEIQSLVEGCDLLITKSMIDNIVNYIDIAFSDNK
jgi:NAD-dependent SIR2 family protein deacetylase